MKTPSVENKVEDIRSKTWIIVASSALPLLIVIIASAWKIQSMDVFLKSVAISLFVFGIGLIAAKLSSYTYMDRDLRDIENLDKAKSDFISIASHQLKSPVASLKWSMEDLELTVQEKNWSMIEKDIAEMKDSVERLAKLTRDLLDVTHIDTNQFVYTAKEFNPDIVIENAIKDLTPLAKSKEHGITHVSDCKKDLIVLADELLLYNVMENLISNAVYYALPSTSIEVKTYSHENTYEVAVTNISAPITDDEKDKLFEKFHRSEYARKVREDGTGLGLIIVKAYIERWDGTIVVTTEPSGKITFTFTIPLKSDQKWKKFSS
jgi:signal transduction histidine kinase